MSGLLGSIATCPNDSCGGPVYSAGVSESGSIRWAECILCGRFYGLQVSEKMYARIQKERGAA